MTGVNPVSGDISARLPWEQKKNPFRDADHKIPMTAIVWGATPSIPSNINTLERLLFHSTSAAQAAWGGLTFKLDNDNPQVPWITMSDGYVLAQAKKMIKVELYLPIDIRIDNNGLNQRPWMYADELSNNVFPVGFNVL